MVDSRGIEFPPHTLYADDIFIFFRGGTRILHHLKYFLHEYDTFSSQ